SPVTAPPPGVTNLKAVVTGSGLDITRANPASSLYSYTVVRIEPSGRPAGLSPIAGQPVFAGTGTAAAATALPARRPYPVVAYPVDNYGNVSAPVASTVAL